MEEEVTYGEFLQHTIDYLKQLLTKPSTAKIDDFLAGSLAKKGMGQKEFRDKLIDSGILEYSGKVDDKIVPGHEKATFTIKYKVPKDRFRHKMKKLHISLFEENLPSDEVITEEGGGATSCASDGAGQFIGPLKGGTDESGTGVIRRKVYVTPGQLNEIMGMIDEATATMNAGNYQYDVPFPVSSDDPTMKHNKGKKHGSAENAIGMDRLTESEELRVDIGKELQLFLNDMKYSLYKKGESSSPTKRDYMIAKYFYELGRKGE